MKLESKQKIEKLHRKEEIDYDCSELNTTLQFPDFEVSMTKQTFINSDRHIKKHKRNIELKVRPKELLREKLRLEIKFLKNKMRLFKIQTDGQLNQKLNPMHLWMKEVEEKLLLDENKEKKVLNTALEKSYLGENLSDFNVLEDSSALIEFPQINKLSRQKK